MGGISSYVDLIGFSDSAHNTNGAVLTAVNTKSAASVKAKLEQSLDIIRHRGPDATGSWISPDHRVGLGHVRLSIVDLSTGGNQPFVDSQGGIIAVVNGELYEYEKYRKELECEYCFKGISDCEIVIALYKHYGLSFVSRLRGEFALVLWDSNRELLFAARDSNGDEMLFKARLEARVILPGHYLLCKNYSPEVQQVPYWDSQFPDKRVLETRSEADMVEGVRKHLIESVRLRLQGDVPVGVYLSGGLDSSCVAGIVAHLIKHEGARLKSDVSSDLSLLHCFTVQFSKESGEDESEIARRTADWLGVQFHPVHVDEAALAARLEDAIWYSETPFPEMSGVSKLALSEKVHSLGLKVVLTGQGSDEHFGGYPEFYPDAIQEADFSWPPLQIPETEREDCWRDACENKGDLPSGDCNFKVPLSTSRMGNHTNTIREVAKLGHLPFLPWTDQYSSAGDPETLLAEGINGQAREMMADKWHPLHTSEYIWTKSFLPTYILRYCGDNVDMAYSVESRLPFLDHHLSEYANHLPPSLKVKYDATTKTFNEKYILREAVRPFITDEIYTQRKKAFCGPTRYEKGGPVYQTLHRLLTKENVDRLGFVDAHLAQDYLNRAFRGDDPTAFHSAMLIAQFVALSRCFDVETAKVPSS
ncbi:hypothetical protein V492_06525 [Pseudogymnoascus sp. VKM F-4246]|nr:hypothetical protein V492_06525 [Pseudogymnoascus sp. VKM F-4246]